MKEQEKEIKRVISYIRSCRDAGIDTTITIDKSRSHFVLNALEEIQQYRAIGTVEKCREAVERNRVKEVEMDGEETVCPICGSSIDEESVEEMIGFCPWCGQAIERSEEDE